MSQSLDSVRIDKWLWAARFYKTRSKAKIAINGGKVRVNGGSCKVSSLIKRGDSIGLSRGDTKEDIVVSEISEKRGNATLAQTLYQETRESVNRREEAKALRMMSKAGLSIPKIRPRKGDRKELIKVKQQDF